MALKLSRPSCWAGDLFFGRGFGRERKGIRSIEVVRRFLGRASTETTQVYTLLADQVADAEIRAARRKRERG